MMLRRTNRPNPSDVGQFAPIHDVLDEVLTPRYRTLISCNG
jgi:hypothetical protein